MYHSCTDACISCMNICMEGCMYVCMYLCVDMCLWVYHEIDGKIEKLKILYFLKNSDPNATFFIFISYEMLTYFGILHI